MDAVAGTRNAAHTQTEMESRKRWSAATTRAQIHSTGRLLLLFPCRRDGKQEKCSVCFLVGLSSLRRILVLIIISTEL